MRLMRSQGEGQALHGSLVAQVLALCAPGSHMSTGSYSRCSISLLAPCPKALGSCTAFPGYKQGCGKEVELLGHKPVTICDAVLQGGGFSQLSQCVNPEGIYI